MGPQPIYLSVVMPVYNEEKIVQESMRRVSAFMALKNQDWELIISSDGSTDKTDSLVNDFIQSHPQSRIRLLVSEKNKGKGAAVRRGVQESLGRYILVTDVDLSAPVKEADKLIRALEEGYDVAIGSRALREPACDVQQSFRRRLAGRVYNVFVQAIALRGFWDTQCGFKCFKNEAARHLFQKQKLDGFSFDVEVLMLAEKQGLKVKEVPVMWRQGQDSHVRLLRDSVRMVKDLFVLRKIHG